MFQVNPLLLCIQMFSGFWPRGSNLFCFDRYALGYMIHLWKPCGMFCQLYLAKFRGPQRAEKTVSQAIQLWKWTRYAEIVKGTPISSSNNMLCGLNNLYLVLCIHIHHKFAFMIAFIGWFCTGFFDKNIREKMI